MNVQQRPSLWIRLGMLSIGIGLAANLLYDYLRDHRVTAFSILFLLALLVAYVLAKAFKWPLYTNQPSRPALISILFLFVVVIGLFLVRVFILKG